jgi:hypothetical protein
MTERSNFCYNTRTALGYADSCAPRIGGALRAKLDAFSRGD